MTTTIILLILNLILLVSLFVVGIWYSRHHQQQITDRINSVHATVKQVSETAKEMKKDLKQA